MSMPSVGSQLHRARQIRNQRQEGLTAEYAEHAENRLLPGSPSAYSAYSAVYLVPGDSLQPANHFDDCGAEEEKPEPSLRSLRSLRLDQLLVRLTTALAGHACLIPGRNQVRLVAGKRVMFPCGRGRVNPARIVVDTNIQPG